MLVSLGLAGRSGVEPGVGVDVDPGLLVPPLFSPVCEPGVPEPGEVLSCSAAGGAGGDPETLSCVLAGSRDCCFLVAVSGLGGGAGAGGTIEGIVDSSSASLSIAPEDLAVGLPEAPFSAGGVTGREGAEAT